MLVTREEAFVDIGYKAEVAIPRAELAYPLPESAKDVVKTGDEIKVFVVSRGGENGIVLSKVKAERMALELPAEQLIDPYGGQLDVERRIIRATSHHFCEDPVRALRAARQAAELDFVIDVQTLEQMKLCAVELLSEPTERLFQELVRALGAVRPALFFVMLEKAGLLAGVFPELHALRGQSQPEEFHPEGDAFVHTLQVLEQTATMTEEPLVRFAALVHAGTEAEKTG